MSESTGGARATARGIALPFREAISFFRQKTNLPTQSYLDVWAEAHTRSFMVAGAATQALVHDFREEVTKALEQGTTLAEFRAAFDALVVKHGWQHTGTPGWRARIIFETNLSTAYSAGRYAQATEPDTLAVYPYWRYVHSGARHPRLQHLSWNGKVLLASDPWWGAHYPPNGWRCGCRVEVLSARGLQRMGRDGPDPSPPVLTRSWTNPRTGETREVPVGIDPGFDYNPGQAWRDGRRPEIPADAVLRPPTGIWPPPAPAALPTPREFASVAEADAALAAAYRPWAESLAEEEARALVAYKGLHGRRMNDALRGRPGRLDVGAEIALLDAALARAAAPEDLRVFRAIGAVEAERLARMRPGDSFTRLGFTSTSISPEIGRVMKNQAMLAEVLVPRGTRGVAYVHGVPRIQFHQWELLMRPATRFRVVSVQPGRIVLAVEPETE